MEIKANGGEALLAGSERVRRQGFPLRGTDLRGSGTSGRDLSSYRRTALPGGNVNTTRRSSLGGGGLPVVEGGGGVVRGAERGAERSSPFGEALFRSKARGIGGGEGGFVRGVGGGGGGIGVGQRATALRRTGGVLSERFLEGNPLLSPAPAPLPSLESLSIGGGVVGLPNGELGGGGLSADLLRALQKYRVAAEIQG